MFERLRAGWRRFAAEKPGARFQRRYRRSRNPDVPRGWRRRALALTLGTVLMALGLVMLVTPGPGVVLLIVGAGFLAEESLWLARLLDGAEIRIRRLWRRMRRRRSKR